MDQFTRRLVGFGVHRGPVDAPSLCRMCNAAIHGRGAPRHLSTDHDPLFEAHRWTAHLRLLEIDEIKTVPHVPLSHPFVERLIGTMRRECLDQVLFWNAGDLERKLADFQAYYNAARSHASLGRLHAVRLRGRTHGGPCRIQPCALDLPLPGHGPASSGGLMTNSRPTGGSAGSRRRGSGSYRSSESPRSPAGMGTAPRSGALVRGCGQAYALQTVEPVTYRCGTRRVCQAWSSGSERDTRARPHAVAPMNGVPEDSRRRSTCTGRTHAPRARADGHPDAFVHRRRPSAFTLLIVRSRAPDRAPRRDNDAVLVGGTTTRAPRAPAAP